MAVVVVFDENDSRKTIAKNGSYTELRNTTGHNPQNVTPGFKQFLHV